MMGNINGKGDVSWCLRRSMVLVSHTAFMLCTYLQESVCGAINIFGRFFRSLFPPYLINSNRRSNLISYLLPSVTCSLSQVLL